VSSLTLESISGRYSQPTLVVRADGIGVYLDESTSLVISWSAELGYGQVQAWLGFFARLGCGPLEIADTLGIEPPGESSTVISLDELRRGLALLTRVADAPR